jgi:hypothetical protein
MILIALKSMAGRKYGRTLLAGMAGALMLLFLSAPVSADGDFESLEKEVYSNFSAGNDIALYDSIEKLLLAYPADPRSCLYYRDLPRMADVVGAARVLRTLEGLQKLVEKSAYVQKNILRLHLLLEKEKLLARFDPPEAVHIAENITCIRRWTLFGPFARYGAHDLDHAYPPEISTRIDSIPIERKKVHLDAPDGVLDIRRYLYPENGAAYACAAVSSGSAFSIRIYSSGWYRFFVNGREVAKNEAGSDFKNCRVIRFHEGGQFLIMMKVLLYEECGFRMVTTDDTGAFIALENTDAADRRSVADCVEVPDYPYEDFMQIAPGNDPKALSLIGDYFSELGSDRAILYYKKSLSAREDPVVRYLYGMALLREGRGDGRSSYSLDGWRVMMDMAKNYPGFIPARSMCILRLNRSREYQSAYSAGKSLVQKAPCYLPLRHEFSSLLCTLSYEREYEADALDFVRTFPYAAAPLRTQARYYQKRDIAKCADLYLQLVRTHGDAESMRALISLYRSQGRFNEALALVRRYDTHSQFEQEYIDLLIENNSYDEAKQVLFNSIVRNSHPVFYKQLGTVEYLLNHDPSMEWLKALSIDPSDFLLDGLLTYVEIGSMVTPFLSDEKLAGDAYVNMFQNEKTGSASSVVLYRNRDFAIQEDLSSRGFYEDVIFVADERGVRKWGEFPVVHEGTVHPLRVRVYHPDGTYADSYRIENVNRRMYINIRSLKPGSILHVAYIIDNPVSRHGKSSFISLPPMQVRGFREQLGTYVFRATVPASMDIRFDSSSWITISKNMHDNRCEYTAGLSSLPALLEEEDAGDPLNYLGYIGMSSMRDYEEFARWYGGIVKGKLVLDGDMSLDMYRAASAAETAEKVYRFVQMNVALTSNLLYYPDSARDVLKHGRGTAEDRAVLAKALLDRLGILSYFAFARQKDLPPSGPYVSPSAFTHILLYVPIPGRKELWLDFSREYNGFGAVSDGIDGARAVVLGPEEQILLEISSADLSGTINSFSVRIGNGGNAIVSGSLMFYGGDAGIRSYFTDSSRRDEQMAVYVNRFIPGMVLNAYRVENAGSIAVPFSMHIEGTSFAAASFTGDEMILRPFLCLSSVDDYITSGIRIRPLHVDRAVRVSEYYNYVLPAGYSGGVIDKRFMESSRFGHAYFSVVKQAGSSAIQVTKEIWTHATVIPPEEYQEYLEFIKKVQEYESSVIMVPLK